MKSFLLIGQSNMAGRGDFGEVPEIINNKCFMLRNGLVCKNDGIHFDSRSYREFGRRYFQTYLKMKDREYEAYM